MSDVGREPVDKLDAVVRGTEGVQPWRRVFHAACGMVLVAFVQHPVLTTEIDLRVLGGGVLACLALDWLRLSFPNANIVFFRSFSALASPREARKVASSTWFVMGAFTALLIVPGRLFAPAVLVLALADPAASVVGRIWGRHPLGKGSWEGTATFFAVACAVLLPFVDPATALLTAAAVAVLEVLPTGIDDNLTVPVSTALALRLAETAWPLS